MAMKWKLFLDDDADGSRHPRISVENPGWRRRSGMGTEVPNHWHLGDWKVARSYSEAEALIREFGLPTFASFDHDLGFDQKYEEEKTGRHVAALMIEIDMETNTLPDDFSFEVHSANPIGRKNIQMLLSGYLKHRLSNEH